MKITKDMLKEHDTCQKEYRWFVKTFPNGMTINQKNIKIIQERDIRDLTWLASAFFSFDIYAKYRGKLMRALNNFSWVSRTGDKATYYIPLQRAAFIAGCKKMGWMK